MTKKLRVTTRTVSKLVKMEDIREEVFKHSEGITPKMISAATGINHDTVKAYLFEIEDIKQKDYGGLWVPVGERGDSPLKISEPKTHDEIITYQIPNYNGVYIEEDFDCGAIKYKFTIGSTSKQATFTRMAVDGVQIPVEIPTIMVVCRDFKNKIKNHTGIEPTNKEIIFKLIELNQDFENMKLNFGNCFTLETLNCLYKIYQKKKGVRVETKLTDVTAETLFEFFRGNYKIIELEEIVKRIAESQENIENYLIYVSRVLSSFHKPIDLISEDKKEIRIKETKETKISYVEKYPVIPKRKNQPVFNNIYKFSKKQIENEKIDFEKISNLIFDNSSQEINKKEKENKPKEETDRPVKDEYDIVYF